MSTKADKQVLEWYSGVPRSILGQTTAGAILVALTFGGFGTWAFTAPLAAAVIATGSFVATGENKIVQHLEGGIIKDLLVREGDRVEAGQELVLLDETAAQADVQQLALRRIRLEATVARLQAQVRGHNLYPPPRSIMENMTDPNVKAVYDSQLAAFEAERTRLDNELGLLEQNIAALTFRREGRASQLVAIERQVGLLKEEFTAKGALLAKRLITRSEVASLERAIADGDGDIARTTAEISEIDAQILRYRQEMIQAEELIKQAALKELQQAEAELDAVREQDNKARSVLGRTAVQAPVSGTIIRLHYHTSGGVIESGKPIMEILPADVPLIIETQIPRMQIDEVAQGQEATIRLTALNQRTTPLLKGTVAYVSADAIAASAGTAVKEVYLARISIPPAELQRARGFQPTPGMPAEILIETNSRTFAEYIVKPITDSMSRAFRED